jgi:hypothetical protein
VKLNVPSSTKDLFFPDPSCRNVSSYRQADLPWFETQHGEVGKVVAPEHRLRVVPQRFGDHGDSLPDLDALVTVIYSGREALGVGRFQGIAVVRE